MKQIVKGFFCSVILLIFALPSMASTPGSNLTRLLNGSQTMQATFKQTIMNATGLTLQNSSGLMMIQRPGKFRWAVQKPNKQEVIVNGDKVTIYDVDLEQVTLRKLDKNAQKISPALLLSGKVQQLSKQFQINESSTNEGKAFQLTPKENNPLFKHISIYFKQGKIYKMLVLDDLGQQTLFMFSKVKLNIPLKSSLFQLTVPKDVDVINEYHT